MANAQAQHNVSLALVVSTEFVVLRFRMAANVRLHHNVLLVLPVSMEFAELRFQLVVTLSFRVEIMFWILRTEIFIFV